MARKPIPATETDAAETTAALTVAAMRKMGEAAHAVPPPPVKGGSYVAAEFGAPPQPTAKSQ